MLKQLESTLGLWQRYIADSPNSIVLDFMLRVSRDVKRILEHPDKWMLDGSSHSK
jgi:hypothetical protein